MRAVRYHEHGGPEVLTIDEVDEPEPGPGEVVVETRAAGVNPVDTYFREGSYQPATLPFVPGSDVAGVVASVGAGVTDFDPGDRVFGTRLGNDRQGTFAERVCAPADWLAPLPDGVTFAEGAAVALVGVTAWRALVTHADLEPAETCLVHGGSGGVGHVAVQLAAAVGARVVTTAAARYHDHLARLGADASVDYGREDLQAALDDAGPMDVTLDTHVDEYLSLDLAVAAPGARVICVGNDAESATLDDIAAAKGAGIRYQFMSMFREPNVGDVLADVGRLVAAGDVVPEIHRTYDLDEAADAQRAVVEESFLGKLVVEI